MTTPYGLTQELWDLNANFMWRCEPGLVAELARAGYDPLKTWTPADQARRLIDAGPRKTVMNMYASGGATWREAQSPIVGPSLRFGVNANYKCPALPAEEDWIGEIHRTAVFSIVWVGMFNTSPTGTQQFMLNSRTPGRGFGLITKGASDDLICFTYDGGYGFQCGSGTGTGLTTGVLYTIEVIGNGTSVTMYVNGTQWATTSSITLKPGVSSAPFTVGRFDSPESPFLGELIGLGMFPTALAEADRTSVINWINEIDV